MTRAAVLALLLTITVAGGTVSWLNLGGEARKDWFWCELLQWCAR